MLAGLLPRITQLSAVLTRGRVVERAVAAAGIDVDRPALSVLITLHTAGGPLRVGEIATRMQVVGPHVTRQVNELSGAAWCTASPTRPTSGPGSSR